MVTFSVDGQAGEMTFVGQSGGVRAGFMRLYHSPLNPAVPVGTPGMVTVVGEDGAQTAGFVVAGGCLPPPLSSVRGTAYEDLNENGVWDADEPKMGGAWFKLTDGGAWFVCGWTGDDSTYGAPVSAGTYYVFPIAPPGWRVTTPRIRVDVTTHGAAHTGNDMGFARDATATTVEGCDLYHPAR